MTEDRTWRMDLTPTQQLTDDPAMHYGFPRIVRAANGDLLVFYRVGTEHAADDASIGMRSSSDGGATWSHERILWSVDPGSGAHNPVALVARGGRVILWCSWFQYAPEARRQPCWWSYSDAHGRTWAPFTVFDPSPDHSCYYVTEAIQVADGLLAADATFPAEGVGDCHTRLWHSYDDGKTWAVRARLTEPGENQGNEVALLEIQPGYLLALLRDRAHKAIFRLWSDDIGATWTPCEDIRNLLGCVLQRPFLTRLGKGKILLTGRDSDHKQVVAYLSTDHGLTFHSGTVIDDYQRDGGYTTVVPTGANTALIAWYSDSHTVPLKPDIKLATLTVSET